MYHPLRRNPLVICIYLKFKSLEFARVTSQQTIQQIQLYLERISVKENRLFSGATLSDSSEEFLRYKIKITRNYRNKHDRIIRSSILIDNISLDWYQAIPIIALQTLSSEHSLIRIRMGTVFNRSPDIIDNCSYVVHHLS